MKRTARTKKLILIAMLCALAYVVMLVGRIPVVMFLSYDPKDVILALGGFLFGPLTAAVMSTVVSLVEMVTVSDTGIIGCVMNILSSCCFACTAALIYKKKHTIGGAIAGLAAGAVAMIAVMLLWNYLITPLYLGYPREAVAEMLIPVFLPFNALKGGLNAAITFLLYKPVVGALRKGKLIDPPAPNAEKPKVNLGLILAALVVVATCVLLILVMQGII